MILSTKHLSSWVEGQKIYTFGGRGRDVEVEGFC